MPEPKAYKGIVFKGDGDPYDHIYIAEEVYPLLQALRDWEKAWDMGDIDTHYSSGWEPPKTRLTDEA